MAADRARPLRPDAGRRCAASRCSGSAPTGDRLVVTHHLLLWDGWSAPARARRAVHAATRGRRRRRPAAGPAPTATTWPGWPRRTTAAARAAWRDALAGLAEPTLVAPPDRGAPARRCCPTPASSSCAERAQRPACAALARGTASRSTRVLNAAWGSCSRRWPAATTSSSASPSPAGPPRCPTSTRSSACSSTPCPPGSRSTRRAGARPAPARSRPSAPRCWRTSTSASASIQRAAGARPAVRHPVRAAELRRRRRVRRPRGFQAAHGIEGVGSVDATHYPLTLVVRPGRAACGVIARVPPRRRRRRRRPTACSTGSPACWTGSPADADDRPVGTLDLSSPAERAPRCDAAGGTAGPDRPTPTVAELLADAGRPHPRRDSRWSFGDAR